MQTDGFMAASLACRPALRRVVGDPGDRVEQRLGIDRLVKEEPRADASHALPVDLSVARGEHDHRTRDAENLRRRTDLRAIGQRRVEQNARVPGGCKASEELLDTRVRMRLEAGRERETGQPVAHRRVAVDDMKDRLAMIDGGRHWKSRALTRGRYRD